ncbi:MAG TPA: CocE/NonD family hydrolase [Candidatus Bathyarchaeia archaeon]|nr:CocE/NonD family hydrolase [Candidatus Bathyarchaeia archaeon]
MRDGVHLNATVYKPKGEAKIPIVFTLTPYVADTYHERSVFFARNGYAFALVDCRGRGNSTGIFEPLANEGRDGHDTVEWLARQPWSNGSVAMWGGSYAGFDQWSTLKEFPPHLKTIVPAASCYPGVDFPIIGNTSYSYLMQWLTLTSGKPANNAIFGDNAFWNEKFREHYLANRPFRELDKTIGNTSTVFQEMLKHPVPDAYWDAMVPSPEQYERIKVPILTITGHYDGDQRGALEFYDRHMHYGSSRSKDRHYLIIGPWDHPGTRTPKREVGGITFGEPSVVDLNQLHKEWYDWTMKNGKKPAFLKKRVAYYVTGTEQWKYADSLEEIARRKETLYLSTASKPLGAFSAGIIQPQKPGKLPPDEYVYDPLDISQADLEKDEVKNFITDQRYSINLSGDGLVYHSKPLKEETEVSGFIRLLAWISMDVPDTDFWVRLYEIKHDGTSIFLTEDWMRARYRESTTTAKLIKPDKIERYEFNKFYFFSRTIAKRSILRLVIRPPNSIYWQKNYNSGKDVSAESATDARTAHVKIFHDQEHTSFLEVPTVKPIKFA